MNPGTEIVFVGDPHGLLPEVVAQLAPLRPKAVVLLGDCDLERTLHTEVAPLLEAGTEVWWIPGNHDSDLTRWYSNLFESNLADRNLHARVVEIAGVRVAGLGGVFRGKWWMPDASAPRYAQTPRWRSRDDWLRDTRHERPSPYREQLVREASTSIWWEDYERLWEQRADVLVCHEAPSCHRHGFAALDDLAEGMGVRLVVHGHHHTDYTAAIAAGRIKVFGVGRAGVRALDGTVIRRGDRGHGRPAADCVLWEPKIEKAK